jgi:hypothetical protein
MLFSTQAGPGVETLFYFQASLGTLFFFFRAPNQKAFNTEDTGNTGENLFRVLVCLRGLCWRFDVGLPWIGIGGGLGVDPEIPDIEVHRFLLCHLN